MPHLAPALRRRLAVAAATTLVVGISPFLAQAPAQAATFAPALDCPAEQYPAAGSPRSAASKPYQVPFNAELGVAASNGDGGDGGYITVDAPGSMGQITLGPPDDNSTTGTLFGDACGTFSIPSLLGSIPANPEAGYADGVAAPGGAGNANYNNNFILHGPPFGRSGIGQPITVGLGIAGLGVNINTLQGTGSSDGTIYNQLALTPAANGGLNASFATSAKATAVINPTELTGLGAILPSSLTGGLSSIIASLPASGGECTLSLGNQQLTGYTLSDTGYTTPATLSTADTADGGKPLTGPIDDAQGVAAASGLAQPPIDPNQAPDPLAPGAGTTAPSTLCTPALAGLLNGLFGLPYTVNGKPGGVDKFVAPITVKAYATQ